MWWVVAYQTGRWLVDQVAVGDGTVEVSLLLLHRYHSSCMDLQLRARCLRGEEIIYTNNNGGMHLQSTGCMVSSCVPCIALNDTNRWIVLE
jgi:hypothetical protein